MFTIFFMELKCKTRSCIIDNQMNILLSRSLKMEDSNILLQYPEANLAGPT